MNSTPETLQHQYRTRGYFTLRGLFSSQEIAAWSAESDRLLRA